MKQILQSLKDGSTRLEEVPAPQVAPGRLLIRTSVSVLSSGTERMLMEFGRASWFQRIRRQPDKVRMVIEKLRTDGLMATVAAVRSKLDQPVPLGYCNVGVVQSVGVGVVGFAVGDRVASNGSHAEIVCVPANLCVPVPDDVDDEAAAFTVLAAIGLQGIRLAQPTLGESVVVIGLGAIGLLAVQMLRAQGCRVMAVDVNAERLALARRLGAQATADPSAGVDAVGVAQAFSRGRGVDAVLIAAATGSSEPVSQAAKMCRKRGRIVLVGVTGLTLARADFYEKELSFQVSCSYGPGRYDPAYEERGQDYPLAHVRWTAQRNFEAALDLMASGALDVAPLVTHRFALAQAEQAYALLATNEPSLGIVLRYPEAVDRRSPDEDTGSADGTAQVEPAAPPQEEPGTDRVTFLGAGNHASRVLMPAFKDAGASMQTVVSAGGVTAAHFARKFGFVSASAEWASAMADSQANAVVIATRHHLHAQQVLAALRARKHVFCEKPLCLTLDELQEIQDEARLREDRMLMVGFNRRFAAQVRRMKSLLDTVDEPKSFVMTVNAGSIPADHWVHDRNVGGGRILGEACHFVDLLRHLAGAAIVRHRVVPLGARPGIATRDDKVAITLEFGDGSVGTIHYLANGHRSFPKERLEVFCAGRVLRLDNFRRLHGWGWPGFSRMNLWRQDKGQSVCVAAFVEALRCAGRAPIPLDEILEVSRVSIELQQALDAGG